MSQDLIHCLLNLIVDLVTTPTLHMELVSDSIRTRKSKRWLPAGRELDGLQAAVVIMNVR